MAKIFKGDVNFGFVINQTGAQPLDSRSVVQSYTDLLNAETFGTAIYNGMTVAVIDEQKVYILVDKTKATVADGWNEIGAGGAVSVEKYGEAVALATDKNIGQVIYVKTKSSYDADGEGEGVAVEYDAAPYIVIGAGSLQKLAASTASGDIEGDVAAVVTRVSALETDVDGIKKDYVEFNDINVGNVDEHDFNIQTDESGNSTILLSIDESVLDLGNYDDLGDDVKNSLRVLTRKAGYHLYGAVKAMVGAVPKFKIEVVTELPETGEDATVYLVTNQSAEITGDPGTIIPQNLYDEYIWNNGKYEKLGSQELDLSGYVTKREWDILAAEVSGELDTINTAIEDIESAIGEWKINEHNGQTLSEYVSNIPTLKNITNEEIDNIINGVVETDPIEPTETDLPEGTEEYTTTPEIGA